MCAGRGIQGAELQFSYLQNQENAVFFTVVMIDFMELTQVKYLPHQAWDKYILSLY